MPPKKQEVTSFVSSEYKLFSVPLLCANCRKHFTIHSLFSADDIHLTGDPNVPLAGRELMIFEAKPKTSLKHI